MILKLMCIWLVFIQYYLTSVFRENDDVPLVRNHLVTLSSLTCGGHHVAKSSGVSQVHKINPD
jgi:hypothetical protein